MLTSPEADFPRWYQDVLTKAELAETGPVRGTMVIRPFGYAIWELMQGDVDRRIKTAGASNVYMPMLIPQSYLQREAEHVEGFSPELAVVTHAGGRDLQEPVVVRPTSETMFGEYMSKWVQSYRDLPLLLNQWANVVRWELRPRIFLRTTEFLWQEGHTAHATQQDAHDYAERILNDVYVRHMRDVLAIPVVTGIKPASERFAGAICSMACEALMADGKALQMGTSHELGQNFSEAFGIDFLQSDGERANCWTTSWGVSTRMVGGLIMCHGDERGLRLPPAIAPIQAVFMQIGDSSGLIEAVVGMSEQLSSLGVRVHVDDRNDQSFGRRVTDWEVKGIPLRVDIGDRDLAQQLVEVAVRETGVKEEIGMTDLSEYVVKKLAQLQAEMLERAERDQQDRTRTVSTVEEALEETEDGWVRMPWALLRDGGEERLRADSRTVRCLVRTDGSMPRTENEEELVAYVGRAY